MRDYCLKFGSHDHAFETLKAAGLTQVDHEGIEQMVGNYEFCAVDVIGVIYKPSGIFTSTNEEGGFQIPQMEAIPGYHVNVRFYGDESRWIDFSEFEVTPKTPTRVWA